MKPKILDNLAGGQKQREADKRTETITDIANGYFKELVKEEITIGELERIMNYLNLKVKARIDEHKENTFVQRLNGETK